MNISEAIRQSIRIRQDLLDNTVFLHKVEEAASMMIVSLRKGGTIHFCGNGGSAADAQHLAAELSGRFYYDRPPLHAEALHCNTSLLTAVGNDYGFDEIFARTLQGNGRAGDVLIAISTSGNSNNILKACQIAKKTGIKIIALTGETGGKIKDYAHVLLDIPSTDTPRIQECHIMIGHILCEIVESEMFPQNSPRFSIPN